MNLIIKSIKTKLKKYIQDKEIYDVILFGSTIKGKPNPQDIDVVFITDKKININMPNFHISVIKPKDFFVNSPTLINTLYKEGYSLKYNRYLSENFEFKNRVLFKYTLADLKPSLRVKIVNILKGKSKEKGMVEQNKGEWIANQVFTTPISSEDIFSKFFINHKVRFNKYHILIH